MRSPSRLAGPVVVFAVAAALVVAGVAGAGPVGISAGQNDSDRPGTALAAALDAGGEALDTPVEAPGGTFDGEFYDQVTTIVASYDDSQPDLGFAGGLITGNVVNFRVTGPEGDRATVSFRVTDDNRLTDVRAGARDDAKIRMTTDRATVDRIANAEKPGTAFRDAVEAGDVRISGRGFWSGIVWFVVNRLGGLVGVF
jgi:hypothetical protein